MAKNNEIRFYRMLGPRSCRIEVTPAEGNQWRMLVVGDFIPTIDGKVVFEHELFTEAEKILSEWAEIARERNRRQGFEV